MSLSVRFWGARGSIPTPGSATRHYGGNTPCVEIRRGDTVFLCDAGTGIREAGLDIQRRGAADLKLHLFFSHTHWDHIQGFPFFSPIYLPEVRLKLWDVGESAGRVHSLLSGQMQEAYFPVNFGEIDASLVPGTLPEGAQEIDGIVVRHLPQPHPGGCSAFSFEADGTKVVYLTDTELDSLLPDLDATLARPDERRRLPKEMLEFVRGADLLVGDGQYTDEAYPRHRGWGHPRATTTVDLAVEAEVKQLAVFHHDPMESDALLEQKLRTARTRAALAGSAVSVFGAREGLELDFT